MAKHVCSNAILMCSMGMAPSVFTALPKTVKTSNQDAGNVMDFLPGANIKPFGMCQSLANPAVAGATAAAMGALTPMPCTYVPTGPWKPGAPTVKVAGMLALNDSSMLNCAFAGVITIKFAGQITENIP